MPSLAEDTALIEKTTDTTAAGLAEREATHMATGYLGQVQQQALRQTLSTQQIQYVKLLQMNSLELNDYLGELHLENPLIELEPPTRVAEDATPNPLDLARWLTARPAAAADEDPADRDGEERPERAPQPEQTGASLPEYLRGQFDLSLTRVDLRLLERLIGSLDAHGYLTISPEALAHEFGVGVGLAREAIDYLRTLDPPGIGGYSLADSLCIQLSRQGMADPVAFMIARDHLEDCALGHFQKVARAIGCPVSQARACYELIRTLNPRPASAFGDETVAYILPDVTVELVDGNLICTYNKQYNASVSVNRSYLEMAQDDPQAKQYVSQKLSQALWVVKSIESRRITIERIVEAILRRQRAFFVEAHGELLPMRLRDVADDLSVHESTVSRAINEKYLQCRRGIFPLKSFFSGAASTEEGSAELGSRSVKDRIRQLIEDETSSKPLSDSAIAAALAGEGVSLARRTVAKYREELGIPSSSTRRH